MKTFLNICLFLLVFLTSIYALMYFVSFNSKKQDEKFSRKLPPVAHRSVLMKPQTVSNNDTYFKQKIDKQDIFISTEMRRRIERINKGCKRQEVKQYKIGFNQTVTRFYYLKSRSLTYCKVPKAGSTFWTRTFLELQNTRHKKFNTKTRDFIHAMGSTLQQFAFEDKDAMIDKENSINFLVSRDPYTRLLSAYMDKYYLLGHTEYARSIVIKTRKGIYQQDGQKCGYNVSFQDFLDHVVDSAFKGLSINRHWAPVFILCRPCNMSYHFINKQESLNQDTGYIMKTLNLSNAFGKSQNKGLPAKRSDEWNNIFTMIETFFHSRLLRNRKSKCPDLTLYLKKIWRTIQSQGIISDKVPFPEQEIPNKGNEITPLEFSEIIFKTMKRYPLTARQKRLQRRRILVGYYRTIKPEIIDKLQQLYSVDFLLFGYNKSPPIS